MVKNLKHVLAKILLNLELVKLLYYYNWYYKTYSKRKLFVKSGLKIQSIEETLCDIIKNKKSISRFGDGELRYMLPNEKLVFQKDNIVLREKLKEVLHSNLKNHIVAMPKPISSVKEFKLSNKYWWISFLNTYGVHFVDLIDFKRVYGNSFISRFYLDYSKQSHLKQTIKSFKSLWEGKELLLVEGKFSRLGVGNDLFSNSKSIQRILCPSKDAFEHYDVILSKVQVYGKGKLILIALGPTATVLAYDLAKSGYWAMDVGHIDVEYMWMLQKAKAKVPIKGRYVAEAKNGNDFEILNEYKDEYYNSIVIEL